MYDRTHFEVESLYAGPVPFSFDSPNPKNFSHEVMVFANSGNAPEAVVPYPNSPILNVPPKISADASTMAMEVNGEVQVFRLSE
jgi:hypothetical protein